MARLMEHLNQPVIAGDSHGTLHFLTAFDQHHAGDGADGKAASQIGTLVHVHAAHRITSLFEPRRVGSISRHGTHQSAPNSSSTRSLLPESAATSTHT